MKTVVNKSRRPLKIRLSRGRVLHLGPGKEGQIVTHDAERESIKKLVEAGELEIFDEAAQAAGHAGGGNAANPDSHGHHPSVSGKRRGDR